MLGSAFDVFPFAESVVPGTNFASVKAMLVRPGTVAVALWALLASPRTGLPAASLTVNLTTGALAMVTLATLTCGASAAQAVDVAVLAATVLLPTLTAVLASLPLLPFVPLAPFTPLVPLVQLLPGDPSPPPHPASAMAIRVAIANRVQCCEGRELAACLEHFMKFSPLKFRLAASAMAPMPTPRRFLDVLERTDFWGSNTLLVVRRSCEASHSSPAAG